MTSLLGTSTSTSTSPHRHIVNVSKLPPQSTSHLCFTDPASGSGGGYVSVPLRANRRLRTRGWEELKLSTLGGGQYRAFRLWDRGRQTILVIPVPSTSDFMGGLSDHTSLGDITLPGTHESCALYGFPISQCQQPSTPIMQQLMDGVRFLDVRLRVSGDELLIYHGPRSQRSSLRILLCTLHEFLSCHPTETLLLCLKEESPPFHPHFSTLVYRAFEPYLHEWFLEDRIPTLGQVRGKGILVTRFERGNDEDEKVWGEGMGIHPTIWPDSRPEGFEWDCRGTRVRTQDWYRVKTFLQIPEKFQIVNHLEPTLIPSHAQPFTLSYTSASYFPLSLPTVIAKGFGWPEYGLGVHGINSRFCRWILSCIAEGKRVRACLPSDFYRQYGDDGRGMAEILVAMNFLQEMV